MSKKLSALVGAIVTAAAGVAVAVVTYVAPENMAAINSAITVAEGAAITIIGLFTRKAEGKTA